MLLGAQEDAVLHVVGGGEDQVRALADHLGDHLVDRRLRTVGGVHLVEDDQLGPELAPAGRARPRSAPGSIRGRSAGRPGSSRSPAARPEPWWWSPRPWSWWWWFPLVVVVCCAVVVVAAVVVVSWASSPQAAARSASTATRANQVHFVLMIPPISPGGSWGHPRDRGGAPGATPDAHHAPRSPRLPGVRRMRRDSPTPGVIWRDARPTTPGTPRLGAPPAQSLLGGGAVGHRAGSRAPLPRPEAARLGAAGDCRRGRRPRRVVAGHRLLRRRAPGSRLVPHPEPAGPPRRRRRRPARLSRLRGDRRLPRRRTGGAPLAGPAGGHRRADHPAVWPPAIPISTSASASCWPATS